MGNADNVPERPLGVSVVKVPKSSYYSHALVAPLIVAPGQTRVIALEPEFVRPQDGCEKQDCELRAAERWLQRNASRFPPGSLTLLGDDFYCHQPFCEFVIGHKCHFAFTCKPDSHAALYQEVELLAKAGGVHEVIERRSNGQRPQIWHYRYGLRVPLRADIRPLYVNWCEVTITDEASGELIYHNAWATDHPLDDQALRPFVIAARTRWKSENENNNLLKNYGYLSLELQAGSTQSCGLLRSHLNRYAVVQTGRHTAAGALVRAVLGRLCPFLTTG